VYRILYLGARPRSTQVATRNWLSANGFPSGEIALGQTQDERAARARNLARRHTIVAGIGDRWDVSASSSRSTVATGTRCAAACWRRLPFVLPADASHVQLADSGHRAIGSSPDAGPTERQR